MTILKNLTLALLSLPFIQFSQAQNIPNIPSPASQNIPIPQSQTIPTPQSQTIPTPQSHFGFNIGDNYQLANYTQTAAYFKNLAAASDRPGAIRVTGRAGHARRSDVCVAPACRQICPGRNGYQQRNRDQTKKFRELARPITVNGARRVHQRDREEFPGKTAPE